MTLSLITNIVLSISAVLVALKTIYGFIRQPKKIVDEYVKTESQNIINKMNEVLALEINTLKNSLQDDINTLRISIQGELEEVRKDNCRENQKLLEQLIIDKKTLKIILHREIEGIYEKGLENKQIPIKDKQHLHTLFKMYKDFDGNGYITNLVNQMDTWETV